MPVFNIRCNLASAIFPFYTQAHGLTIVDPKMDENFDRYNAANTTPDKGVPQVYYMENVMPIANGYQSVAYKQMHNGVAIPNTENVDQIVTLFGAYDSNVLFAPDSGQNWIFDGEVGGWINYLTIPLTSLPPGFIVTYAYINGVTYIFYSNYNCYAYEPQYKVLSTVTLISLTVTNIGGICAACGYLITWSGQTVNWSSLVNPLDFTPSIDTGAGGGTVQYCKGNIKFCLPIVGGFIIYCEKNIVQAQATNNINYPFVFREASNSGGVSDPSLVAYQPNLDTHIALTSNGLQAINLSECQAVMPEIGDFLASQLWEVFNPGGEPPTGIPGSGSFSPLQLAGGDTITQSYLPQQAYVKLAGIQGRYIVISVGQTQGYFNYAFVFDTVLNRYGRLAINHTCCFNYIEPNLYQGVTYAQLTAEGLRYSDLNNTTYAQLAVDTVSEPNQKQQLAFCDQYGVINLVDFSLGNPNGVGVFLLGKYEMDRNAVITHNTTIVESVDPLFSSNFSCCLMPSLDGKTLLPSIPQTQIPPMEEGSKILAYGCRYTAKNVSILYKGSFHLTSTVLQFQSGGFR